MIAVIFILFFLVNEGLCQNFVPVLSPDIESELNDVCLIDDQLGWIVGNKGILLKTTDGGNNWIRKNIPYQYDFLKVFFYNQSYGWIGTANGRILITVDGGENWNESLIQSDFTYFDAIYFTNPLIGHISVGKYRSVYIMRTTDGGMSWNKKDSLVSATTASRWYDIDFYDENFGVIVGDKKDAQRYTTDGGNTWLKSNPINDVFFRDQKTVKWLNSTDVISLGEGNEYWGVVTPIYKSTDGGKTWNKKTQYPLNNYDRVKDSYFKNPFEGIAVGSNGFSLAYISKTTDGGENWYASFLTYSFGLKAIAGYGDKVIVLGIGSHILISNDFGLSWNLHKWFTPNSIYGIQFIGNKGFAITRYSDFYKTDDVDGNIWYYKSSAPMWESVAMQFINETTGFILKENRHIVKTTDGGESWRTVLEPVPFNARNKVGGLHFPTTEVGYAWMSINDYGEYHIYKTTDQGENWFEVNILNGPGYISGNLAFFDENIGIIAGPQRWMIRTTNGGVSWDTVTDFISFPVHLSKKDFKDIVIINENKAWAVGIGFICLTTNKGISWNYIDHGINNIDSSFYTISFYNDSLGFIATYNAAILKTSNSGLNWQLDTSLTNKYIIFSSAVNKFGRLFLGTSNGYLIASEKLTSIENDDKLYPEVFTLYQNYPNPFNSRTKIKFSIPNLSGSSEVFIELEIFDLLGRKIKTLVSDYYKPGIYEIDFSMEEISGKISSNLIQISSGIFFYRLRAGNLFDTKKMIYLK